MAQATLTVWNFDTAEGADQAVTTLEGLARENIVTLHDAATVSWPEGRRSPRPTSSRPPRERGRWAAPSGECCSG